MLAEARHTTGNARSMAECRLTDYGENLDKKNTVQAAWADTHIPMDIITNTDTQINIIENFWFWFFVDI